VVEVLTTPHLLRIYSVFTPYRAGFADLPAAAPKVNSAAPLGTRPLSLMIDEHYSVLVRSASISIRPTTVFAVYLWSLGRSSPGVLYIVWLSQSALWRLGAGGWQTPLLLITDLYCGDGCVHRRWHGTILNTAYRFNKDYAARLLDGTPCVCSTTSRSFILA
jgi:hypothetical protein